MTKTVTTLEQQAELLVHILQLSPRPLDATNRLTPLMFLLQKAGLPLGVQFRRGEDGLEAVKFDYILSMLKMQEDVYEDSQETNLGGERKVLIAKGTAPLQIGGMLSTSVENILQKTAPLSDDDLMILADLLWFLRKGSMGGATEKETLSKAIDDVKKRKPVSCTTERIRQSAQILMQLNLLELAE